MIRISYYKPLQFLLLTAFFLSFFTKETAAQEPKSIPIVKVPVVQTLFKSNSDTTYVINFWATWCAPCVAELHYFEELREKSKGKPVRIVLVSVDFKKDNAALPAFVKKHKMKNEVWHLQDGDPNNWMPQIDEAWSGSIPATIVLNNAHKYRKFLEGMLEEGELEKMVTAAGK